VVVWPDADEVGRKAGAALSEKLPQARVLDVTGLPDGFDAADLREPIGEWLRTRLRPSTTFKEQKAEPADAPAPQPTRKEQFYAVMPQGSYVFTITGEFWSAPMIDKRFGKKTSTWIAKNRPVEQMTWAPGEGEIIHDKIIREGGWLAELGMRVFNQYRAPKPNGGDPAQAGPWLDHVKKLYPDDWEHIQVWCAQRVQFPQIKINHALVLGGAMGIGKDTLLEPVKHAIGHWNMMEVSPQHMLATFNGHAKSVILRISEARDLGESDRFKFHDHMKAITAAPPDTILVNEKHLKPYSIPNVVGIIITTNHKADGIYLPADDRRHYVAWSQAILEDFEASYFNELYCWYDAGGIDHAAAYLRTFDLEGFDPKAPPAKTRAFWDIANASRAPEEAELADVIERMGDPKAITLAKLKTEAMGDANKPPLADIFNWLNDRKNLRALPHKLDRCGYTHVNNPNRPADGLWKINKTRVVIYAKSSLSIRDQIIAARELADPE
jgi:hypothetical protein